ncbi:MAG: NAD(+)/NADH kinase [Terriglobales bacterium]
MKTAAIISKPSKPELYKLAPELVAWLRAHDYKPYLDEETAVYAPEYEVVRRECIAEKNPDFVIVLGGDGTLLSAARAVSAKGIPIIAVNLGSLGFLTEVPLSEMYDTLEAVERKACPMEIRGMLHCELVRGGRVIAQYDALNDAVVNKSAIARLVDFDLYIDNLFVSNYKADGVIISTPTGSTAYSMAAGGPILMPSVDAFVIAPVCPHSLSHRPLVVKDTTTIEILARKVERDAFLSIDGQVGLPVLDEDKVVCSKSKHHVKLLRLRKTFFEVLRTKLKWGQR